MPEREELIENEFCPKCKEQLEIGALFCPKCGAKIKKGNKKVIKKIITALICLVLISGLAGGIYMFIDYNKKAAENECVVGEWVLTGYYDQSFKTLHTFKGIENNTLTLYKNGTGIFIIDVDGEHYERKIKYFYSDSETGDKNGMKIFYIERPAMLMSFEMKTGELMTTEVPDMETTLKYKRK